ncbi:Dipeptidyl-peptidase 5, partial [Coemansia spiralis]
MLPLVAVVAVLFCAAARVGATGIGAASRPLDIETFHSLGRVGAPVVSPNQELALFLTSYYDHTENKSAAYLNCLDISSGTIAQLTENRPGLTVSNPLWFDDQTIGFVKKGALYRQELASNATARVVYDPPLPISNVAFRQKEGVLSFIALVRPNATLAESVQRSQENARRKDSAMVYDNLWARHWNEWSTLEKPNVFVAPLLHTADGWRFGNESNLAAALPQVHDPLMRWHIDDYAISPAGDNVAFVTRPPAENVTWSTNVDIYLVPTAGTGRPRLLTARMDGMASAPTFSPDGLHLAWLQMETPGYESDINRIFVYNITTRQTTAIAYDWDLSPHSLVWARDSKSLFATAGSKGCNLVFAVDAATGKRRKLTSTGAASAVRPVGDDKLLYVHSTVDRPGDLYMLDSRTMSPKQMTEINKDKLEGVHLSPAEEFWFAGAQGDRVHGWVLRPFGFDRRKKYPLA